MSDAQTKLALEAIKQLGAMGCEAIRQAAGLHSINQHNEAEEMIQQAELLATQIEGISQGETVALIKPQV